jgi:hypothetical protein
MTSEYTNHYVDVDGRTYRVALHNGTGRAMICVRRGYDNRDAGQPLTLAGKVAKAAIAEDDPTRQGIFRSHNCWPCKHGAKPCVQGAWNRCDNPRARND